jgi:hypothetical protein
LNDNDVSDAELRLKLVEGPRLLQELQASWSRKHALVALAGPLLIALVGAAASIYSGLMTARTMREAETSRTAAQLEVARLVQQGNSDQARVAERIAIRKSLIELLLQSTREGASVAERAQGLSTVCDLAASLGESELTEMVVRAGETFATTCMPLCPQEPGAANAACGWQCDRVNCWFKGMECSGGTERRSCSKS